MPNAPNEAMRESEATARAVLTAVPDLIFRVRGDGTYVGYLAGRADEFYVPPPQFMGKRVAEVLPEDVARKLMECAGRALRSGGVESCEYALDIRGERRWFEARVLANGEDEVLHIVRDISARKVAEGKLLLTQFAVDHAADGIFWIDRDARFVYVNDAACRSLGYSREELLGMTVHDIDPQFPPEKWRAHWEEIRRHKSASFETIHRRKSGETFPVAVTVNCLDYGGREYNCAFSRDVTESRKARESLERAKAEADAANAAKDRFLAVLSHELRTPLTPVLAAACALQRDARLPADALEELVMIRRNVELEARLIDDLLDLTRIARGKLVLRIQTVDLWDVLRHALKICWLEIEGKGLAVQLDLHGVHGWVEGDASRMQQVFWNLLTNAVKFTPPGGRVRMSGRTDEEGRIVVEVVDDGIGIEADVLPRLFNAFEQGGRSITRDFGGLGLGLAITRGLVEMHHGTIGVGSEGRGRGTTFRVVLPGASAPADASSKEPNGSVATPGFCEGAEHGWRVLLVEDHADTARIMGQLLRACGYEVRTAGTVAAALQAAEGEEFDLLISDLGLPDGSGLELVRELHRGHPALRGIALSGYGMDEDIARSREAGFVAHLTKPVNFEHLRETIGRAMAKRQGCPVCDGGRGR